MRTVQTEVRIYKYEELSEQAKEKAKEWWREGITTDIWSEFVIDDAKQIGKILGIDIKDIFFSGFYNQGDGAQFKGEWTHKPNAIEEIHQCLSDKKIINIAFSLNQLQEKYKHELYGSCVPYGPYTNEYNTIIDLRFNDYSIDEEIEEQDYADFQSCMGEFMRWIYNQLESAYEAEYSDEVVEENLINNDCEFLSDGSLSYY